VISILVVVLPGSTNPAPLHPFDAVTEAALRRRGSAKWRVFPPDVLPAWVAEMDYPLAEPIRRALVETTMADDTGYAFPEGLGEAFAQWVERRWAWRVGPSDVALVVDVVTGIAELLRVATAPGDRVVIEPPVYPPFAASIRATGRVVVDAPLTRTPSGWTPDLSAIARAYEGGARAHLLCSPQNPTGIVYEKEALVEIGRLALRHSVLVISDEIHAPLTLPGAAHHPFPSVSEDAARTSVVLTSASKAWNVAGLKAAVIVACSDETRAVVARLPKDLPYHAGHFGVVAARAAFIAGDEWLANVIAILDRNRALLGEMLADSLPAVRYVPPRAGYLAWLDCTALGLGDDPAQTFLERGRVALSPGPTFGDEGKGFARLNIATTRALLEDAIQRMRRATEGQPRTR
jgi:cystathionine beta-lyase